MGIKRIIKNIFITIGIIVFIISVFLSIVFWWMSGGVYSTSDFDSKVWFAKQTNETDFTCYRGSMAHDIQDRFLSIGTSSNEVKNLLGEPDIDSKNEYGYILGMCSGLGFDYDTLHIYFDEKNKLTKSKIYQH